MNQEQKIERMKELIELLNRAGRAYYQESREIMSNFEYDRFTMSWPDWSGRRKPYLETAPPRT